MEALVIVAAIVAGLLLNAWNQRREHLVAGVPAPWKISMDRAEYLPGESPEIMIGADGKPISSFGDITRIMTAQQRAAAAPQGFDATIKVYRDNYLNFKTTGKQEYRIAYIMAQAQIEQYINEAEAKINKDGEEIKKFVQQYSDSGTKLQQYSSQANEVLRTGPEIGDQYTLEKKLREPVSVNMKPIYVKLVVAGLIALVGAVALLLK